MIENDFCHNYDLENRVEVFSKNIEGLYSTPLETNNVLMWEDFSFLLIERIQSAISPLKKIIHIDDVTVDQQITDYINHYGDRLCHRQIDEDYIKDSLKDADYKFVAVKSALQYHGQQCDVVAFRLLKDLDTEYYFLYNFNVIQSMLVCSVKVGKEVTLSTRYETVTKTIHPSLGSFLTYKSAQFAKEKNFQYYYMRAADLGLVKIYQEWGFHFGMPLLNLDHLFNEFLKQAEDIELTNDDQLSAREQQVKLIEEKEKLLLIKVKQEIYHQLTINYRFASLVMNASRTQWKDILLQPREVEKYVEDIGNFIVKVGNSFSMYLDLYSDDMSMLKNYSLKRMKTFFKH
jgi:hypothetical protein